MSFFDWARSLAGMLPPVAHSPPPRSALGTAALEVARGQIGRGEQGANNVGPDLDLYRNGGPAGAWCAAFVSWCIISAANVLKMSPPIKRSHSAKRLFANCLKVGARVASPAPGDIVCWTRGAKNAATGHIGIVSRVEDGAFHSVEGNVGIYPSRVREYLHEFGEANLIGFARLP
jgi:hypothetical protein